MYKREREAHDGGEEEGDYLAALRGSKSGRWLNIASSITASPHGQQRGMRGFSGQQQVGRLPAEATGAAMNGQGSSSWIRGEGSRAAGSGRCFKCGTDGHWARDCTMGGAGMGSGSSGHGGGGGGLGSGVHGGWHRGHNSDSRGGFNGREASSSTKQETGGGQYQAGQRRDATSDSDSGSIVARPCACGGGDCVVLTARTERNMGRKFFACPNGRDASCGFFEWCDNAATAAAERGGTSHLPSRAWSSVVPLHREQQFTSGGTGNAGANGGVVAGGGYRHKDGGNENFGSNGNFRRSGSGNFGGSFGGSCDYSGGSGSNNVLKSQSGRGTYAPSEGGVRWNAEALNGVKRVVPLGSRNGSVEESQSKGFLCPCGGGPCRVLVARTPANSGRPFFKCPKFEPCSFFKWCDEAS